MTPFAVDGVGPDLIGVDVGVTILVVCIWVRVGVGLGARVDVGSDLIGVGEELAFEFCVAVGKGNVVALLGSVGCVGSWIFNDWKLFMKASILKRDISAEADEESVKNNPAVTRKLSKMDSGFCMSCHNTRIPTVCQAEQF